MRWKNQVQPHLFVRVAGCRVQGAGCRVQGSGLRACGRGQVMRPAFVNRSGRGMHRISCCQCGCEEPCGSVASVWMHASRKFYQSPEELSTAATKTNNPHFLETCVLSPERSHSTLITTSFCFRSWFLGGLSLPESRIAIVGLNSRARSIASVKMHALRKFYQSSKELRPAATNPPPPFLGTCVLSPERSHSTLITTRVCFRS